MDVGFEDFHELGPRLCADGLDGLPTGAQHDLFVRIAGDIDHLIDLVGAILLDLEALGFDGDVVGDFVVDAQEQLLARHFGRRDGQRKVGELVFGEVPGAERDAFGAPAEEILHAIALEGRNHEGAFEPRQSIELAGQFEQGLALDRVDLIEHQHLVVANIGQPLNQRLKFRRDAALGIDNQRDKVGIARAGPCRGHHGTVQPTLGSEDAGRIDEDDLRLIERDDAADLGARGLGLVGDDGNLGAHQGIEQGRLAGIRRADQGDEATAGLSLSHRVSFQTFSRTRNFSAALCSASFFDGPVALVGSKPFKCTAMVNSGA